MSDRVNRRLEARKRGMKSVIEHIESIELTSGNVGSKACFCARKRDEQSGIDVVLCPEVIRFAPWPTIGEFFVPR